MTSTHPPSENGARQILLVEDQPSAQELIGMVLLGCGFQVISKREGIEGLKMPTGHRDTLSMVLTDRNSPV